MICKEETFNPENFGDRIIFMSMFNDICLNEKNYEGECISNSEDIRDNVKRISQRHWAFLGLGEMVCKLYFQAEARWNSIATQMQQRFEDSIFTSINPLSRGILKRRKTKDTIHFTAEASNVELLLRIIHSANQLSMYGAVSVGVDGLVQTRLNLPRRSS